MAKTLEVPISTIHYNLKALMDAGIIEVEEFHYSQKGKEVNHYKLANKYIIIAPKGTYGIKEKLKSILPVGIIAIAGAGVIQLLSKFQTGTFAAVKSRAIGDLAASSSEAMMGSAAEKAAEPVAQAATPAVSTMLQSSYALWFLYGATFTLAIYLIWDWIRKR